MNDAKYYQRWRPVLDAALQNFPCYRYVPDNMKINSAVVALRAAVRGARSAGMSIPEGFHVCEKPDHILLGTDFTAAQRVPQPPPTNSAGALVTEHINEEVIYSLVKLLDYRVLQGPILLKGDVEAIAKLVQQQIMRQSADVLAEPVDDTTVRLT